jgi:molybdopterin converting factor small subunit
MRITVKLYATLRKYGPPVPLGAGFALDLPEGADVAALAEHLGLPEGVAWVAMVNDQAVHMDHKVVAGDTVSLFPPVAGG